MSNLILPQPGIVTAASLNAKRSKVPVVFSEEEDTKQEVWDTLGDLDDIEIAFNDVLIIKYIRTELSKHLVVAAETQREDNWQGSIGLVLKVGPRAFKDDENNKFYGFSVARGDWVMFRNSDGWDRSIQELYGLHKYATCRLVQDAHIRAKVKYPGRFMGL